MALTWPKKNPNSEYPMYQDCLHQPELELERERETFLYAAINNPCKILKVGAPSLSSTEDRPDPFHLDFARLGESETTHYLLVKYQLKDAH